MIVHCSTTMASYVGATAFGSPSLLSWKTKTLSTDFGIVSAENKGHNPSLSGVLSGQKASVSSVLLLRPEKMEQRYPGTSTLTPLHRSQGVCGVCLSIVHVCVRRGDLLRQRSSYSPSGMDPMTQVDTGSGDVRSLRDGPLVKAREISNRQTSASDLIKPVPEPIKHKS